jgi:hypothetical protein
VSNKEYPAALDDRARQIGQSQISPRALLAFEATRLHRNDDTESNQTAYCGNGFAIHK